MNQVINQLQSVYGIKMPKNDINSDNKEIRFSNDEILTKEMIIKMVG